jgi:hypothetical protein
VTAIERVTDAFLEKFKRTVNDPANPVLFLGIDPGVANGICGYDANFHLVFAMTVHENDIVKFLNSFNAVEKCVCESYKIYSNKYSAHVNSDVVTLRVIGRIEHWTRLNSIELTMQPATIKNTAYMWLGQKPPTDSNPFRHQMDGNAHFMFWAIKKGLINAADLLRSRNK